MATVTQKAPASEALNDPRLKRQDRWWVDPLIFFLLFSAFGLWATFRAFQNDFYNTALQPQLKSLYTSSLPHYLSPLYSPTIDLYQWFHWQLPNGWQISPALLILPFPLSFRLTCYYYRRSIYRAYLLDPAGCAITEPEPLWKMRFKKYMGERAFPFVAMNFHRFAFYAAVVFIVILWYDALLAFFFINPQGGTQFGVGLGTLVFLANIILLSLYTFSCHSWRHLIGGNADCYSCSALNRTKFGLWQKVSFLNEKHGRWAMLSLVSVGLTDVYVYLVTTQAITDLRLF
jgi:hypothetical protein